MMYAAQKPTLSRLQMLQSNFQNKLLREKEKQLYQFMEKNYPALSPTVTHNLQPYRNDILSAPLPGNVRNYFNERKKQHKSGSAGQTEYYGKKKEGYDKSRPLMPIERETRTQSIAPIRKSPETGRKQSKISGNRYGGYQQKTHTHGASSANDFIQEDERHDETRKQIKGRRQEKQHQQHAEIGRRRREESERRQKELAGKLKADQEMDRMRKEEEESDELATYGAIRELEEQLKMKQKDLEEIQRKRIISSPESSTALQSPSESFTAGAKAVKDEEVKILKKPKKVYRKDLSKNNGVKEATSQPLVTVASPSKSQAKHAHGARNHEMNLTYKISREDSLPLPAQIHNRSKYVIPDTHSHRDSGDNSNENLDLVPCLNCGRSFASDRLPRHQKACKKVTKPRKKYDITAKRIAGSGAEEFIGKTSQKQKSYQKKPSRKDWRTQHREFIEAIRYAKMASAVESKGGNVASLPPPPKSENLDYVQCPHCSRKFNEAAADRHIPKCRDIKAKPKPLMRGAGRRR